MESVSWRPFSTRALLCYALAFNVVVVVLAEVQRRSLVYRIEEMVERQDDGRKDEARRIHAEIGEQGKRLAEMQSAAQVLTKNGRFASSQDVEAAIVRKLEEGKQIIIRFDDSDLENRDSSGAVLCGPEAENGYLGVFIAGAEYTVNYERQTHQWIGTGPVQSRPSCRGQSSPFGPKELGAEVSPHEAIVLWGGRFKLRGLDVYLSDQKVGRVVGAG